MSNHECADDELETGRLTELARVQARAEARAIEAMIGYRDAEYQRIAGLDRPLMRQVERAVVVLEIGQAMGLSEAQVHGRLASADRVREHTPRVWLAFHDGTINEARMREISSTVDMLQRDDSYIRLDQSVVAYAESHTVSELRRWLRRFVDRVETDLALERAEQARERRRVDVRHGDDGMATLLAGLTSPQAAAAMKRLTVEAKAMGADDPRTLAQRQADLLASWLTNNEDGETSIHAHIAVKLSAETFTGARDGFAESADGSWSCPASWVLSPDLVANPIWHRLIVDPVTDDVLAHQYLGRLAPESLKLALLFRDGVCQAPGCLVPADRCDGDHRQPWPDGPTSGENMWPLCRRHHILKGHRIIQWVLPSGRTVDAEPAHRQPPESPPSRMEHRTAHLLANH
ncbi:DUF222 domain-containing protein [Aeromicrobium sp. CF3.5]|uniref:HNH endonuclease signature motif containing protein n=1 Tax=Aeromicrobium sp. CF3.5 TaxID=3373078 RepID=UPI003EE77026